MLYEIRESGGQMPRSHPDPGPAAADPLHAGHGGHPSQLRYAQLSARGHGHRHRPERAAGRLPQGGLLLPHPGGYARQGRRGPEKAGGAGGARGHRAVV